MKASLFTYYTTEVEACFVNRGWGLPNQKFTGILARILTMFTRIGLCLRLCKDPRQKELTIKEEYKKYGKLLRSICTKNLEQYRKHRQIFCNENSTGINKLWYELYQFEDKRDEALKQIKRFRPGTGKRKELQFSANYYSGMIEKKKAEILRCVEEMEGPKMVDDLINNALNPDDDY